MLNFVPAKFKCPKIPVSIQVVIGRIINALVFKLIAPKLTIAMDPNVT